MKTKQISGGMLSTTCARAHRRVAPYRHRWRAIELVHKLPRGCVRGVCWGERTQSRGSQVRNRGVAGSKPRESQVRNRGSRRFQSGRVRGFKVKGSQVSTIQRLRRSIYVSAGECVGFLTPVRSQQAEPSQKPSQKHSRNLLSRRLRRKRMAWEASQAQELLRLAQGLSQGRLAQTCSDLLTGVSRKTASESVRVRDGWGAPPPPRAPASTASPSHQTK